MADDAGDADDLGTAVRRLADRLAERPASERHRALAELTGAAFRSDAPQFGSGDPMLLPDILSNLPGSVFQFLLHPDGTHEIPFLSRGVSSITGLTSRDVTNDPDLAFSQVHPDDLPEVQTSIRRSAESLETWTCAYRTRHVDGSLRWALGIGSPRRLPSGAVLWNTVNVDITDQKRAELAARERDRQFRAAFEASHVCMALLRPDGRVVEANDALARTLGADAPEALEGRALADHDAVIHPDRLRAALGRARGGHGAHLELALELEGGSRLLSVGLSPIRDDDGRTASILFDGVDVTSRRERERLEHLMVLVGETVAVGGFTVHPQPEEVRLHASSAGLLEVPEGRESLAEFAARFGPDDARDVLAGLRSVLQGSGRHWSRDVPYGGDRWVRLYASSHPTSEPGAWCVGAVQDVTQQRVEEAEFRHAQRLDALGRLAGGVAHDFNNLLTAIMGSAELLVDAVSAPDRPLVDEITLAANLGKAMTQRLLTLARKQPAHPVSVDLGRHLVEAIPLWRRMVGERVHVQVAVEGREHWVRFDPRQFDQVVMNLLLNARDAMPAGGTIEVGLEDSPEPPPGSRPDDAAPGWHRLTVRDHGCGMSSSTVERVLEPFFTTKGGEGTGLGLSTALAIVQQAGGVLRIDSREGEGTVVSVWLPRHAPRPESRPARVAQPRADGGLDVLLIEDDARVRRAVARMLKHCGHRAHEAADAAAAERTLERVDIDLVLTDVVMPGVSGPALVEQLRARRPGLRVLFMSGYPGPEARRLGMAESDPILSKPFTLADLEAKLRAVGPAGAADPGSASAGDGAP